MATRKRDPPPAHGDPVPNKRRPQVVTDPAVIGPTMPPMVKALSGDGGTPEASTPALERSDAVATVELPPPVALKPPKPRPWVLDPAKVNLKGVPTRDGAPAAPPFAPVSTGAGAAVSPRAAASPLAGAPSSAEADPCNVVWHTESWMGLKASQEDRAANGRTQFGGCHMRWFGVYDGHGGSSCSEYLVKHLHAAFFNAMTHYQTQVAVKAKRQQKDVGEGLTPPDEAGYRACFTSSFAACDKDFLDLARRRRMNSGSTAIVALLTGNTHTDMRLHVANTGDCRGVLCKKGRPVRLSEDHKPNRSDERLRILGVGGAVVRVMGVWRVTSGPSAGLTSRRTLLSVSRSFGDMVLKEPTEVVSSQPDIKCVTVDQDDLFFVLACDGIWDVLSDEAVVEVALPLLHDPAAAATAVVRAAFQRGSEDNLTATVVVFPWAVAGKAAAEATRAADAAAAKAASEEEMDMFA